MRRVVRTHLRFFSDRMPRDFDLRGANIGNLILAGGYLANDRNIESVLYLFSKLVEVRGSVRPVCDANLHLRAELEDGSQTVGQHRLTGKAKQRQQAKPGFLRPSRVEPPFDLIGPRGKVLFEVFLRQRAR